MSQNFVKLRQKYRRQIRKKQLQQQFQSSRKSWRIQQLKNEQIQFYKMRGQINEENYCQFIPLILNCCYNDSLNFMLLPFVPYIYQHIINHSYLQDNLIILQALTQFQEIQLPQTEQLVHVLIQSLSQQGKIILNIISNLLENHKYQQILRDLLLQANFMYHCQQALKNFHQQNNGITKKDINYLYFSICCKFIKSHPNVDNEIMEQIGKSLVQHVSGDEQKYELFHTLSQISQTFHTSIEIATLLYNLFIKLIIKEYIQFQEYIIQFFIYCVRSKLFLEPFLQKLVVDTLQSNSKRARSKALTIIQLQMKRYQQFQRKFIYKQYKQMELLEKLSNLYVTSQRLVKIECLQCFYLLTRAIVIDQSGQKYVQTLIQTVSQILDGIDNDLLEKALNILLIFIQTIHQEQLKESPIFALIQRQNIHNKLSYLSNNTSSPPHNKILQQILSLMTVQ